MQNNLRIHCAQLRADDHPVLLTVVPVLFHCCAHGDTTTPTAAAAGTAGTPSGAVAQSKVAAKEQTVSGLSGSGGAVRVLAPKQAPAEEKPADRDAVQKKAERDAEAAKR